MDYRKLRYALISSAFDYEPTFLQAHGRFLTKSTDAFTCAYSTLGSDILFVLIKSGNETSYMQWVQFWVLAGGEV